MWLFGVKIDNLQLKTRSSKLVYKVLLILRPKLNQLALLSEVK